MSGSIGPRIVVDWASNDVTNLGDAAMLQSIVTRIRHLVPFAEIIVPTNDAAALERLGFGMTAVPAYAPRLGSLPGPARTAAIAADRLTGPLVGRGALGRAVAGADLVVAAGGGYVNDHFPTAAHAVLHTLWAGSRHGARTAALGQGFGPLETRILRAHAARVLSRVDLVTVRDEESARLAAGIGVTARMTGDDAHEIAVTGQVAQGARLGLNVRLAGYSGIGEASAEQLRASFSVALRGYPTSIIPISHGATESDIASTATAVAGTNLDDLRIESPDTPTHLRDVVGSCGVMVTAAYHAAVFALAQGVPVVGVAASPYYQAKLGGLRSLFGPAICQVLTLAEATDPASLSAAIARATNLPQDTRADAVEQATAQRTAGRTAVADLLALCERTPS
jgi:polysaccharide pyruvyl transferase WcaK-like protein